MFRALAIAACLFIAACTTTNTKLADAAAPRPPAGSRILIIQPDIQLSLLTVAGLQEPRADWTQQARDNIAHNLESAMVSKAHTIKALDPATALEGRPGQLLRLHESVGQSIMTYSYGPTALPTKKGAFDWTLGEGARELGQAYEADYALFTYGRGTYSSNGRKMAMIGAAALGVSLQAGGQSMFASLVDLKTGRVVWFNTAIASPGADMRTPEGAASLTQSLLKDAPL